MTILSLKLVMFRPIHIVAFLTYFTFCASAQFDLEQEEIKLNQELLAFRSEFTSNGMDIASENFSAKMKVFLNLHKTINLFFFSILLVPQK